MNYLNKNRANKPSCSHGTLHSNMLPCNGIWCINTQVGVQKWCRNIICLENELSKQKTRLINLATLMAYHTPTCCHVMAFGALTLRRLMSYIYGAPILDVSRSHTTTQHSRYDSSGRVISSSQRPLPDNTRHSQQTNIHAPGGIRTHDFSR